MVTAVTHGVKISVETEYQPGYSSPVEQHFVFTYRVTIENMSEFSVKLLRRHWFIHDVEKPVQQVEGEGVVGQKPILEPGQKHQYVSGCSLLSGFGKMHGTYTMQRIMDGKLFKVIIPEFTMILPFKLN
jgi:ApaG protein